MKTETEKRKNDIHINKAKNIQGAMTFIFLMGIVSLFSDMTHEGARGAQESIMKAVVSKIIPKSMRSTGFGIFETGFGISWFLGSWLLGALYDRSLIGLVSVSIAAQLMAIAFYGFCIRQEK